MSRSEPVLTFPKRFFWGAATSGHQVEGKNRDQWTIWELENAPTLAQQARYGLNTLPDWDEIEEQATNPRNYISGKGVDHYNRYEEDFDILAKLNMNAFRFSIEWSRIEPREGEWDPLAVEHYRLYIHALKRRNIEPFVTLWHWTMPEWFVQKGGFEKRANVKYFVRFATKILDELGEEFRYVTTINEPEVYSALGYSTGEWPPQKESKLLTLKVYLNLGYAHRKVYKAAKTINRKFIVGLSTNIAHNYAGDNAIVSKITARLVKWSTSRFFLNRVHRHLDFIGLNYYFSNRYYGYRVHNPNERISDLGWDMQPQDVEHVLVDLWYRYRKPIIITESGVADRKDQYRKWWIAETVGAMHRAMKQGVNLDGYIHWSLLDNFEWAYGFWPRFGLVAVDYKTGERTVRQSAILYGRLIKRVRKL
ncbi:MAG TPA: family 1 glycosylhydrolase [Candidatus Saccharimonadales bacterium]|nr:family 1 glycosylhydrolase [Candidatus Saccharimonadales bacterium]